MASSHPNIRKRIERLEKLLTLEVSKDLTLEPIKKFKVTEMDTIKLEEEKTPVPTRLMSQPIVSTKPQGANNKISEAKSKLQAIALPLEERKDIEVVIECDDTSTLSSKDFDLLVHNLKNTYGHKIGVEIKRF